jgi:APA family basic amino acid/polyamine antiporter
MSQQELQKTIGLGPAITIVIGSIIGSTIFMKPATMAAQLGSPYMILIVWLVAGIISLFGAMAFAELGAMLPETGGQYIYLKYGFGDFIAFLYGWSSIAVINTAAIAAIGFVCAEYANYFFHFPRFGRATEQLLSFHIPFIGYIKPLENIGVKSFAIFIIMGFSLINYLSVRAGNAVQFIATVLKVIALLVIVFGILFSGKGDITNFIQNAPSFHLKGWPLFVAFMAATTGAFASYDGWNNLNMVAGEIKNPGKNITRSLIIGLFSCILIYLVVTLAYMYVLPLQTMALSPLVASDATTAVWGVAGGTFIALLIVVSTLGATNVNLLTNARIVFAMSESGTFFRWAGKITQRHRTPGNAVLFLGIWSSLLVLSGSFDALADMFIFMSWIFYGLVIVSLFVLRKKMPGKERPYKVWGYPLVPTVFLLFTIIYIISTLYYDITNYLDKKSPLVNSVFGLALTATGIPFYFWFKRRSLKKQGTGA